jgi:1-(5-phosphoribosyl)-5-[(5-phosphoribosylamino)methylideneamino] imidazole-4-carboxamide isomerase/N-(5'phosphoribosyl)anthranilate isomerase
VSNVPADTPLILLPAVDVVGGKAVRLVQGVAGSETDYGSALDAALGWQSDGAAWIHLVDLDAAFGRGSNRDLLAEVIGTLDVAVELSGGIRDDESLSAALSTGCARVNVGTAALENPEWCARMIAEHGDKVAVGLDVKLDGSGAGRYRLRGRGWETDGGDLWPVLERLDAEGCSRFVVTDVTKSEPRAARGRRSTHGRSGHRLRRRVEPRRPACHRHPHRCRYRGCHRRESLVRRKIHASRGARRSE